MALINCPECAREISDRAVACPQCGAPVGAGTQVIEQTAKRWKLLHLASAVLIAFGLAALSSLYLVEFGPHVLVKLYLGLALLGAAAALRIYVQVMIWWRHR